MVTENRSSRRTWLLQIALLAAAYAVFGRLGQLLAIPPGNVTAVWPSSGIALAAVLRFGPRVWPGICIGSFLANTWPLVTGPSLLVAVVTGTCIGVGASLEALAGAAASKRFGDEHDPFSCVRSAAVFLLISTLLSCTISATIGAGSLYAGGYVSRAAFPVTWWTWWQGDAAGVLVVTPLVLTWTGERRADATSVRAAWLVELLVLVALAIFIAGGSFGAGYPIGYLLIPLLIWAVFRFGPRGATGMLFAVSSLAIYTAMWGIARGTGLFVGRTPSEALLLLHAFIDTAAATTLTLMAVIAERKQAEVALADHGRLLEVRVTERTAELEIEVEERKRTQAALADHSRSLEARVAERTAELNRINERLEATVTERTTDLSDKLFVIEKQQEMLLQLSTPVLQIWDGVLVLPLIGTIDGRRAAQIMEGSLTSLAQHRARIFIIDITGAPFVDSEVANYLIRTARAARLLGVKCMLVGISPRVAQVLVQSGADLHELATFGTLQSGLLEAMRRMSYQVVRG